MKNTTSEIIYWKTFYENNAKSEQSCSNFCEFVVDYFKDYDKIVHVLDCGCGNGRDSFELGKKYQVKAIDSSGYLPLSTDTVKFSCDDFISYDKRNFQLIYSRFTFHSITNNDHEMFLDSINNGTYLAIEARSVKGQEDDLYHGKEHYRNYIDKSYLMNLLDKYNFKILYIEESDNFAVYKNENPICIRTICVRNI